jgi:hypothetical protein
LGVISHVLRLWHCTTPSSLEILPFALESLRTKVFDGFNMSVLAVI